MMRDLINIDLPRYGTRMLVAGDRFEAKRRDARVLTALKRARYADESDEAAKPTTSDDIAILRGEYQAIFGKRPFHGWSADELKAKIAAGPDQG